MLGRIAMSLLGGTSAGAALMYLLDPEHGEERQRHARRTAREAYATAADTAASGWESLRENAGPTTARLRSRLSEKLASASRAVAPADETALPRMEYDVDRMDLAPTEAYTAMALSRHSRDMYGDAREAYARARDMYYDALIDLDLARAKYRRETPGQKAPKAQAKSAAKATAKTAKSSWSRGRKQVERKPDYLTISLVAAGCCAVGAAAMFMMDPVAGRRRRAVVRDKTVGAAHTVSDRVTHGARYAQSYATGKVAQAKSAVQHRTADEVVSDDKLVARVRSDMGRVLSHPGSVEVTAVNGSVTVRGPVLASEFDALMKCVYAVPGVREVVNQVETHATPAGVPGLQG